MSTTARPHVDLAPASSPRPGLALLLALLAIPGSTIAWELPAGGFWIGLPLAVAAIVLGLRARRVGATGRGKALAAVLIGTGLVLFMATWTVVAVL